MRRPTLKVKRLWLKKRKLRESPPIKNKQVSENKDRFNDEHNWPVKILTYQFAVFGPIANHD